MQLASADQPTQEVEAIPTPYGGSQTFLNWGHCVNYAHETHLPNKPARLHTHSTDLVGGGEAVLMEVVYMVYKGEPLWYWLCTY